MQEVAEGAHHDDGVVVRQAVEQLRQFGARLQVVVAAKAHAQLAHVLDDVEHAAAFLLAQGVTQHAAEQADVVEQRLVLVVHRTVMYGDRRLGLLIHLRSFQKGRICFDGVVCLRWRDDAMFHPGLLEFRPFRALPVGKLITLARGVFTPRMNFP